MATNREGFARSYRGEARFDEAHITPRGVVIAMREADQRRERRRQLVTDLRSGWLSVWRFFGRNRVAAMVRRVEEG